MAQLNFATCQTAAADLELQSQFKQGRLSRVEYPSELQRSGCVGVS